MADSNGKDMASPQEHAVRAECPRPWDRIQTFLHAEGALLFGALTTALFYGFADTLTSDLAPDPRTVVLFLWLFATMLWCAFGVVRHADCLAEILGEPYGTLILTLAVIAIEVALICGVAIRKPAVQRGEESGPAVHSRSPTNSCFRVRRKRVAFGIAVAGEP